MFEGYLTLFWIQLLFSLSTRLTPSGATVNLYFVFPGTNCP